MDYLAHSAGEHSKEQSYCDHVEHVTEKAVRAAEEVTRYMSAKQNGLSTTVKLAAQRHDLGKLSPDNQAALHNKEHHAHLPVNHVDAGTASLLQLSPFSALAIYSHHRGLPDLPAEALRQESAFRDPDPMLRARIDGEIATLLSLHDSLTDRHEPPAVEAPTSDPAIFCRMALSCLADADHSDTASLELDTPPEPNCPPLRPKDRLAALDRYVDGLASDSLRSKLRSEMYRACQQAVPDGGFMCCNSPVGSGKTTAVMAYLLHLADVRSLRRIFIVLPYTNIITQSVEIYRNALTLPGEDPSMVVAELHHRAEFDSQALRKLTALWRAPIVVTTAVAFFETLAANRPSALRRLHELPGSAIFVDEAHTALPLRLIPLTWCWMSELARNWGCHWILASGSLVRFWQIPDLLLSDRVDPVPDLIPQALCARLMTYEARRIRFRWASEAKSRSDLVRWVASVPGPRLLIVNTVQSAAVLADDFQQAYGREFVEHLSTALTPDDRRATLDRVKARLKNTNDENWVLVATTCVEAGVDLSFRTGFRECSSLLSLLQTAGRVNRSGETDDAEIWTFTLQDDPMLVPNRGFQVSARILEGYFRDGVLIEPDLSTRAIQDELSFDLNIRRTARKLCEHEQNMEFHQVAELFHVIDSDTVPAVVDTALVQQIRHGGGDWRQLQLKSVSIARYNILKYRLQALGDGLYAWTLPYDTFLGYMAGVLGQKRAESDFLIV